MERRNAFAWPRTVWRTQSKFSKAGIKLIAAGAVLIAALMFKVWPTTHFNNEVTLVCALGAVMLVVIGSFLLDD